MAKTLDLQCLSALKMAILKSRTSKELKSSHISEAIAAAFRRKSHAALLSDIEAGMAPLFERSSWSNSLFASRLVELGTDPSLLPNNVDKIFSESVRASYSNTRVWYMYRDGDNYKVTANVVFHGKATKELTDRLSGALDDMVGDDFGSFIPGQVGVTDIQNTFNDNVKKLAEMLSVSSSQVTPSGLDLTPPQWHPDRDHVWHTIEDIEPTDADPTDTRSFEAFVEDCERTEWDDTYKPPFYEEMVANYVTAQAAEEDDPEI